MSFHLTIVFRSGSEPFRNFPKYPTFMINIFLAKKLIFLMIFWTFYFLTVFRQFSDNPILLISLSKQTKISFFLDVGKTSENRKKIK